jgi:Tfp pilus assembly protein PilF
MRSVKQLLRKAGNALSAGRTRSAIRALEQAIHLGTDDPEVRLWLAGLYAEEGEFRLAEQMFKEAISLAPRSAMAHLGYGQMLFRTQRFREAEKHLRRSARLQPSAAKLTLLGRCQIALRRDRQARISLQRALSLDHDFEEAYYHLAVLTPSRNRSKERLLLKRAVSLKPDYCQALGQLALVEARANKWGEAEGLLNKALKFKRDEPYLHLYLANVHRARKDLKKAESEYLEAIRVAPSSATPQWTFADFLSSLGQAARARVHYERAVRNEEKDPTALRKYAEFLCDSGRKQAAKPLLQQALRTDPTDRKAAMLLADLHTD